MHGLLKLFYTYVHIHLSLLVRTTQTNQPMGANSLVVNAAFIHEIKAKNSYNKLLHK